jgi:hypothetical protein
MPLLRHHKPAALLLLLQVNYMMLSGLTTPQVAAILGHSSQAMSTFTTLHSMLSGLVAGKGPQPTDVAASVVQSVYDQVKGTAPTNAPQVRSTAVLCEGGRRQHVV